MTSILPVFFSLLVSLVASWSLSRGEWSLVPKDVPNNRSLHEMPVPRAGGVAILLGFSSAVAWISLIQYVSVPLLICLGLLPIVVVGLLDDWREVSPFVRLIAQFIAAITLLVGLDLQGGRGMDSDWWLMFVPVMLIGTVWAINAYNFMDGMDGFAGSMAFIGFVVLAVLGVLEKQTGFSVLSLVIASAVAGFLVFNWPKASIFLGDTGSTALGFLAVALGSWGVFEGVFPFWVPFLVFSPFWVDATVTLLKRAFRGEKIWQAHREHYYQRLVLMGWGHKKTLYAEIALMLSCAGSAVFGTFLGFIGQMTIVIMWVLVYVIILTVFPVYERRHGSL